MRNLLLITALCAALLLGIFLTLSSAPGPSGQVAAEEPPARETPPARSEPSEAKPPERGEPTPAPEPTRPPRRLEPTDELFAGSPSLVGHLDAADAPAQQTVPAALPARLTLPDLAAELDAAPLMLTGGDEALPTVLGTATGGRTLGDATLEASAPERAEGYGAGASAVSPSDASR